MFQEWFGIFRPRISNGARLNSAAIICPVQHLSELWKSAHSCQALFGIVLFWIREGYRTSLGNEAVLKSGSSVGVNEGQRVVGLIFYGRREYVSILDCCLKRNLKANGGLLDEVIFAVKTQNRDDLDYLDELVLGQKEYFKYISDTRYNVEVDRYRDLKLDWFEDGSAPNWHGSWEAVSKPNTIYIKIDDDVVYIDDGAIRGIVQRLIHDPQYFAVSANIVNGAAMQWIHFNLSVYEPFYPDLVFSTAASSTSHRSSAKVSWRTSDLPSYQGPPGGPEGYNADGSTPAPFQGHRRLPVRLDSDLLARTFRSAAPTVTFNAWDPSVLNWAAGAQAHYSFLQHLENEDTWRYHFPIWNYNFTRLALNFYAVRGQDVMAAFPFPTADDEEYLTVSRPKELARPVVVDGSSLVAHFTFDKQRKVHNGRGLAWTDLLSRYKSYAEERVCQEVNEVKFL